jgi:hypothetical protein
MYVAGNSDIPPIITAVTFITLFINRCNNRFLPLLWQFFLIKPELISLWISEGNVLPPVWIFSAGI